MTSTVTDEVESLFRDAIALATRDPEPALTAAKIVASDDVELFFLLIRTGTCEQFSSDHWEPLRALGEAISSNLDKWETAAKTQGVRAHKRLVQPDMRTFEPYDGSPSATALIQMAWPYARFIRACHVVNGSDLDDGTKRLQKSFVWSMAWLVGFLQKYPDFVYTNFVRDIPARLVERAEFSQALLEEYLKSISKGLNNFDPLHGNGVNSYLAGALLARAGDVENRLRRQLKSGRNTRSGTFREESGYQEVVPLVAASTLRKYKKEPGYEPTAEHALARKAAGQSRQEHRDPTNETLTVAELSRRYHIPESTCWKTIRRIEEKTGSTVPRHGRYVRLDAWWQREILALTPAPRGKTLALHEVATRTGTPLEELIELLRQLDVSVGDQFDSSLRIPVAAIPDLLVVRDARRAELRT